MLNMKKLMVLLSIIGLVSLLPAVNQSVNFSGTWVRDVQRRDLPAMNSGCLADI
jgi:hypothetical protein